MTSTGQGHNLMPTPQLSTLRVFIENEAGSDIKHHYNEETFEVLRTERVGAEYPYPYGFVPGTLAPDGDAADCFVITNRRLQSGDFVDCEPVALLEQTEGGATDHNVIAMIPGEQRVDLAEVQATISTFVAQFRAGFPGQEAIPGRLLPAEKALEYLETCEAARQRKPPTIEMNTTK
jgi:inorganic pyrophosphatase